MSAQKEHVQGIIVADSFASVFQPISQRMPKALFPLANVPMIDYSIMMMIANNIDDIVVFCCAHAQEIAAYLKASKWMQPGVAYNIRIISSQGCHSFGDAMREIDSQGVISADVFVLCCADIVSNVNLKPIISKFRERRTKDTSAVMDILFKRCNVDNRLRKCSDETLVVVDAETHQVLHLENIHQKSTHKVPLSLQLFEVAKSLQAHLDWAQTGVMVCAPEVMFQFVDSFYENVEDFISGVLVDEVSGLKLFGTQLSIHEYGASVHDMKTYDQCTRDILHRWVFPLVLEQNLSSNYTLSRSLIYKQQPLTLAQDCVIGPHSAIASGCALASSSRVEGSVLGRACVIGAGAHVINSILWDGCVVESGACVIGSLLCTAVSVANGAVVGPDCVVDSQVKITSGAHLSKCRIAFDEEGDSPLEGTQNGVLWTPDDEDDDGATLFLSSKKQVQELGPVEDSDSDAESDDPFDIFLREVNETITRGISESLPLDTIHLEINSLKFQGNHSLADCCVAVLRAALLLVKPSTDKKKCVSDLKAAFAKWMPLVKKFLLGEQEMLESLLFFEEFCTDQEPWFSLFVILLQIGYDVDLFTEDTIMEWHKMRTDSSQDQAEHTPALLQQCEKFIQWLEDAEEESDSDD